MMLLLLKKIKLDLLFKIGYVDSRSGISFDNELDGAVLVVRFEGLLSVRYVDQLCPISLPFGQCIAKLW